MPWPRKLQETKNSQRPFSSTCKKRTSSLKSKRTIKVQTTSKDSAGVSPTKPTKSTESIKLITFHNNNLYNLLSNLYPMDKNEAIKEAFLKAKQDIFDLQARLYTLRNEFIEINKTLSQITEILQQQTDIIQAQQGQIRHLAYKADQQSSRQTSTPADTFLINPAQNQENQAQKQQKSAQNSYFNTNSVHKMPQYALKTQYTKTSTGNKGVPADRQTDQQADKNINFYDETDFSKKISSKIPFYTGNEGVEFSQISPYSDALDTIESLKTDIASKFRKLTQQEFAVFAAIYQLGEEGLIVDYPLLASKLKLTESSIRDYAQKLIKKGIPIIKNKENNKRIFISIDQNLRKIASLPSILALRES